PHSPDGHVSVVFLSQVLEHLVRPQAIFEEIHRILKPDGVLAVEVPSMAGLQVHLLGARWGGWAPNMHVWQFTPKTLRASIERFGFETCYASARHNMHVDMPRSLVKRILRR